MSADDILFILAALVVIAAMIAIYKLGYAQGRLDEFNDKPE